MIHNIQSLSFLIFELTVLHECREEREIDPHYGKSHEKGVQRRRR